MMKVETINLWYLFLHQVKLRFMEASMEKVKINHGYHKSSIQKGSTCELCGRHPIETTEHHLIPKELGGRYKETAKLCIPCHKQIHALYSNRELSNRLYNIDKLQKDEKVRKFLTWIRKQPPSHLVTIKKSRERRRNRG